MRIRVFQTAPKLLDLQANLDQVVDLIRQGCQEGAQLNIFPELALTGYFVSKRYHEVALRLDSPEVERLAQASQGTAAVVGFIEEGPSMNFYNSALVLVDGELVYSYRKLNLPNYGDFEERKIFSPGSRVRVFRLHGYTVAVLICNDMWHPNMPYLAVTQKADIIVTIINSSESAMGDEFSNIESWEVINKFYARIFGIYLVCVNRVGLEQILSRPPLVLPEEMAANGKAGSEAHRFWGGSEIINPFGQVMAKAALFETDTISADLERELLRKKRILLPYLRQDDPYFTKRELDRILKDRDNGEPGTPHIDLPE